MAIWPILGISQNVFCEFQTGNSQREVSNCKFAVRSFESQIMLQSAHFSGIGTDDPRKSGPLANALKSGKDDLQISNAKTDEHFAIWVFLGIGTDDPRKRGL